MRFHLTHVDRTKDTFEIRLREEYNARRRPTTMLVELAVDEAERLHNAIGHRLEDEETT